MKIKAARALLICCIECLKEFHLGHDLGWKSDL